MVIQNHKKICEIDNILFIPPKLVVKTIKKILSKFYKENTDKINYQHDVYQNSMKSRKKIKSVL